MNHRTPHPHGAPKPTIGCGPESNNWETATLIFPDPKRALNRPEGRCPSPLTPGTTKVNCQCRWCPKGRCYTAVPLHRPPSACNHTLLHRWQMDSKVYDPDMCCVHVTRQIYPLCWSRSNIIIICVLSIVIPDAMPSFPTRPLSSSSTHLLSKWMLGQQPLNWLRDISLAGPQRYL